MNTIKHFGCGETKLLPKYTINKEQKAFFAKKMAEVGGEISFDDPIIDVWKEEWEEVLGKKVRETIFNK